jgi:hypothetical protein
MPDEGFLRGALTVLFFAGMGVYVLLGWRSRGESLRVAAQWGTDASDAWANGKTRIMAGVFFMFLFGAPWVASPYREIGFFMAMGYGLLGGEFQMGTGFKIVADAQESWHRWYERELAGTDVFVQATELTDENSQITNSEPKGLWTRLFWWLVWRR